MGAKRAAIINMSSILGSIEINKDGGIFAYRASKVVFIFVLKFKFINFFIFFLKKFQAALNAVTKSLSIDLYPNRILCVSLHPGWVRTDMGGSKAPLDVETSTCKMVETILSFNESHNGGFYQYNGKKLPW